MELKAGTTWYEQHGIGRFLEMRQRTIGTGANKTTREYLVIEYAPSKRGAPADKLFIPTDQLDLISKYIGAEAQAQQARRLRLGGHQGQGPQARPRDRRRPDQAVLRPPARQGLRVQPGHPMAERAGRRLPYQETADQLTTIDEVKSDMEKPVPMDRLICGDVGFGKTEIALRAAFKAVQDGKQVAVLVPTTLLVQQHYETFSERFEVSRSMWRP